MQIRIRLISFSLFLIFFILIARLFFWQIIKGDELAKGARLQQEFGRIVSAPRGNIYANDQSWLAARGEAWLVYAYLPDVEEVHSKIADKLAPFFVDDETNPSEVQNVTTSGANRIKSLLAKEGSVWVPLKHKVTPGTKKNIEALDIRGIGFEFEESRFYPEASSAAHLLGFVGKNSEGEDQGYFGLEGYYDLTLSGKPGFVTRDSDARGVPILAGDSREIFAVGGVNLVTHIKKAVQITVDKNLADGIELYGAKGGTAIVMDPKSGGIIAAASFPSYDPKNYFDYGDSFFADPIVSSAFEPGSIFKVIIMASALDAGVVEVDTTCDICSGPVRVDKYTIETWNQEYRSDSNMTDVIVNSDNVGMVFVGDKLGKDKMHEYLEKFGVGQLTGIDLQGEMTPKLREKDEWSIVDLATASFGQGIATTPIQIIKAVGAIANNGVMVTPQVVDYLISDQWEDDLVASNEKEVVSEKAADEITAMMVEAAKNGEAKWTHARGFNVAGKTGTAQIPIAGHYDAEKTIASFIGFAPADNPKFIMLVTLHEPQTSPWASETAAPLWYSIAKDLFLFYGIQPED